MINQTLLKLVLGISIFSVVSASVYFWHYKPMSEMIEKIDRQEKTIENQGQLMILYKKDIEVLEFEKNSISEYEKAVKELHEMDDVNMSDGWHELII